MANRKNLSDYCVYTLLHSDKLNEAYRNDGRGSFEETSKWVTGRSLFLEAQQKHQRMPIIFSAADVSGGLIFHALLEDIHIDESDGGKPKTTYTFSNLQKLPEAQPRGLLKLKSSGKSLSDKDIYPYRICHTPDFLLES